MPGSFEGLPADEPYHGVTRRSFSSEHVTVTRYSFAPGASFPLHRHPQEQITLVEAGQAEMTIGERVESLSPGEWTIIGPEVDHGLRAGPEGARILAIVAPRRDSGDVYTVVEP